MRHRRSVGRPKGRPARVPDLSPGSLYRQRNPARKRLVGQRNEFRPTTQRHWQNRHPKHQQQRLRIRFLLALQRPQEWNVPMSSGCSGVPRKRARQGYQTGRERKLKIVKLDRAGVEARLLWPEVYRRQATRLMRRSSFARNMLLPGDSQFQQMLSERVSGKQRCSVSGPAYT